ncbi:MAG: ribonuclease HII, partial [Bdellovibrionaceae bacterium]|nr:ribonuclease HII [Pseudobdellovibrionaceae bacterium]
MTKAKASRSEDFPPFDWQVLEPAPIIGVDEVGRGCLAGSVYAAAVILNSDFSLEGVTDSKLLSETRRELLAPEIERQSRACIGIATVEEIAEINILQATFLAMRRAIEGLRVNSGHILVDGNQMIPKLPNVFRQTTLVKGDLRASPIAAASIVAKVARDRYMAELADRYPGYGFEKHKGYASPEHKSAIQRLGPCIEHRRTVAGVREYWPH